MSVYRTKPPSIASKGIKSNNMYGKGPANNDDAGIDYPYEPCTVNNAFSKTQSVDSCIDLSQNHNVLL